MAKKVIGVFENRDQAEQAVEELRRKGFEKEISVIAKDTGEQQREDEGGRNSTLTSGTTTGGVLGGLAGLAAGAGALVIPGIGPIIAMGPIAGLLSGAAAGGIAGGLIDWGIPEEESRRYEEEVKQGRILLTVESSGPKINEASGVMRDFGAKDIKSH